MQFLIEGVFIGLMLASLLGPIFIALTQTAIEKGARAGLMVGVGIWVSDIIIVTLCYLFIQVLSKTVESLYFKFWLGLVGGCILMIFGIASFLKKIELNDEKPSHSVLNYAGFWLKGFLVNTINPFTFIFWIGAISTYIIGRRCTNEEIIIFLTSILMTIVITDSAKVFLAKAIRNKLRPRHISWITKIAGAGLFIFGVILILRIL